MAASGTGLRKSPKENVKAAAARRNTKTETLVIWQMLSLGAASSTIRVTPKLSDRVNAVEEGVTSGTG
jgi:hypothetical protein